MARVEDKKGIDPGKSIVQSMLTHLRACGVLVPKLTPPIRQPIELDHPNLWLAAQPWPPAATGTFS